MSKTPALIAAVCLCTSAVAGASAVAASHSAATKHHKAVKRARAHGLSAPTLLTPANGEHVQQVPTLTWGSVGGAAEYEYQIAADPRFNSIVLGKGAGLGTSSTHNLAAALSKPVTDGTYYWRVRGLTRSKEPGPWSSARTLVQASSATPQLLAPGEGASITWPSVPLVLSWSSVPHAFEYIVTIAADPGLSTIVLGSATSPQKTQGTVFALPGTLSSGTYYWAITPLDAEGHRGRRSRIGSFTWSWPTITSTQLTDLSNPFGFEPQFGWAPIPGAAHYEVEVNQSPEFPQGSIWCCKALTTGTSLSPSEVLGNNHAYYWRVRALDANGNAGVWNYGVGEHGLGGEGFTEAFDNVAPTVPNLTMASLTGSPLAPGVETETPIVTWSPAPGAASYEVQVTEYIAAAHGCDFLGAHTDTTSALAWTPLSEKSHSNIPGWPSVVTGSGLAQGVTYCLRVRARSDHDAKGTPVVSDWTQLGGLDEPAFTFLKQKAPVGTLGTNPSISYIMPGPGSTTPRTPLFTWNPVEGAASYYVVIARDASFTEVVDVASTTVTAYAPQLEGEEPLNDQTNAYYWAVVPFNNNGEEFALPPQRDHPQTFTKFSVPPSPRAPINGVEVSSQPTFSWGTAEGALNYTLEVASDPTFVNPIDNVRTDSTAYTSSSTYPANATLYWRVRANDPNYRNEALNWSATQEFRRTLPVPTPSAGNATSGEAIPALSWSPVSGAVSYDVHLEQPDGSTKDFQSDSNAFTPTAWDGPGIWRWQVRAEFPTGGYSRVPGGYFSPQPFAHTLGPPAGAQGVKSGSRIVISWNPEAYAKEYEVEISTSDTFSSTIETERTVQSSWAPNVDLSLAANRHTLFWRVAARDDRGNVGTYATGAFAPPKAKCVVKRVKKGKKVVKKCVKKKHK